MIVHMGEFNQIHAGPFPLAASDASDALSNLTQRDSCRMQRATHVIRTGSHKLACYHPHVTRTGSDNVACYHLHVRTESHSCSTHSPSHHDAASSQYRTSRFLIMLLPSQLFDPMGITLCPSEIQMLYMTGIYTMYDHL